MAGISQIDVEVHIRFKVRRVRFQPFHRIAKPLQVLFRCPDAGQSGDFSLVGPAEFHEVLERVLRIGEVNQRSGLPEAVRVLHQDLAVAPVLHDSHEAHDRKALAQRVAGDAQGLCQVPLRRQLFSHPDGPGFHRLQQAVHDKLGNLRSVVLDLLKLHITLSSHVAVPQSARITDSSSPGPSRRAPLPPVRPSRGGPPG